MITQDVPPFSRVVTERETKSYGVNTIGLERKGFSEERLKVLARAFRLLSRSKMNTSQALAQMRKSLGDSEDVRELIRFIETAERGIVKSAALGEPWRVEQSDRLDASGRCHASGDGRASEAQ